MRKRSTLAFSAVVGGITVYSEWGKMSGPEGRKDVLTVFFLREAGSACSSSDSDVTSDSEELLLESLPSSDDEPSLCPSGTFFFVFFFPPSSSLCSLKERGNGRLRSSSPLSHRIGEALRSGSGSGDPGPAEPVSTSYTSSRRALT